MMNIKMLAVCSFFFFFCGDSNTFYFIVRGRMELKLNFFMELKKMVIMIRGFAAGLAKTVKSSFGESEIFCDGRRYFLRCAHHWPI